ncbi:MAG: DUF6516 family protein [bacterium]
MTILESLEKNKVVRSFIVQDIKNFTAGFYLKICISLIDDTKLFVREFSSIDKRDYSYHWQKVSGELICRWDNAPYHKEFATFPHHKHFENKILPSSEITVDDVLKIISDSILKASS